MLDAFNNFNRPQMARGDFMWGGMAVVISPNVPQFHAADELVWVKPAWVWRVLWRLFGADPNGLLRFKPGVPVMEEQAFQMAGKLFMSPKMWDQIKQRTAQSAE